MKLDLLCAAVLAAFLLVSVVGPAPFREPDVFPGYQEADASSLFFPMQSFVQRSLRHGELPLWNPHSYMGHPLFITGQTGLLYPPAYLVYPWLPTNLAIHLDMVLHVVVLWLSMAYLGRTAGASHTSARVAATAVALSPLCFLRYAAGHTVILNGLAWLPAITASFLRLARGEKSAMAPAAIFLGLALQAPHIQLAYYMLTLGTPLLGAVAVWTWRRDRVALWRTVKFVSLALAVGCGLGATQILGLAEMAIQSDRAGGGRVLSSIDAIHPVEFLTILGPEFLGDGRRMIHWGPSNLWETKPSYGFVLCLLALAGLTLTPSVRTGSLLAVGLGMAMLGAARPQSLHAAAGLVIPGFAMLRAHARLNLLVLVVLGTLAGQGITAVTGDGAEPRRLAGFARFARLLALALAALAIVGTIAPAEQWRGVASSLYVPGSVYWPLDLHEPEFLPGVRSSILAILARCALLCLGVAVAVDAGRRPASRPVATLGLLLVIGLEFTLSTRHLAFSHRPLEMPPAVHEFLRTRPQNSRVDFVARHRAVHTSLVLQPLLLALEAPSGWSNPLPLRILAFLNATQSRPPSEGIGGPFVLRRYDGLARLCGVSRVIGYDLTQTPPGTCEVGRSGRWHLLGAKEVWKRAWVVHRLRYVKDVASALSALASRKLDPALEAVVQGESSTDLLGTPSVDERVSIIDQGPNELILDAELESRGLVVLAESFDPGWQAWVSALPAGPSAQGEAIGPARAVEVVCVNGALRGVELQAGRQRVRMRYRPRTWLPALGLTIGALLVLGWIVIVSRRILPELPDRPRDPVDHVAP